MRHANSCPSLWIVKTLQAQQDRAVAVLETVSFPENVYRKCPKVRGLKQIVSTVTAGGLNVTKTIGGSFLPRSRPFKTSRFLAANLPTYGPSSSLATTAAPRPDQLLAKPTLPPLHR